VSAKTEQKERTRAAIVDSACRLLRERGIDGARVADVMGDAGLTVGGFYAHFANKGALLDEALRRTAREMRARLVARIEEKPASARGEVILKRYLSPAHRDDPATGCPLPAVVGAIATAAPEHRGVLAEELGRLAEAIAAELPPDRSSARRATALAMIALMYGGLSLARAVRGQELSDEILRACRAFGKAALDAGR
jgi:TetR/AcrR family transcriptional regulator, transcriptional repressor for nem operon